MKTFILCALSASFLAVSPAAAAPDLESWLANAIDRQMDYPDALAERRIGGVVTVRFHVGADRRPDGVTVIESSGVIALDKLAANTVSALEDIPADAPAGPHLVVLQYGTAASAMAERQFALELRSATEKARLALNRLAPRRERLAHEERARTAG